MLSIVINFFNNRREAENTLYSLTRAYQRVPDDIPYEVIVVDNGSTRPLAEEWIRGFGTEFTYRFVSTTAVSPVNAINEACRDARGEELLVIIDGAHIVSPGVLREALNAFTLFPAPFIATVPFHLGPKSQNISVSEGYTQVVEDRLMDRSGWKANGYKLFGLAGAFADGSGGWFGCLYESGCFGIRECGYFAMGGLEARFQSRGGGLVSLDFFHRAVSRGDLKYTLLLGEGTFHQVHGGVASNAPYTQHPWKEFHQEYMDIRGMPFSRALRRPFHIGSLSDEALPIAKLSMGLGVDFWRQDTNQPINAQIKGLA